MSRGSTKESLPSPTGSNMALFFLSSQDSTFEANVPGRRMVHGIPRERSRCSLSLCHCASRVGAMKSASTCRAESLTICPTPPFLAAAKALPSMAGSMGPAESTNALSTPAKAGASVSGFSRSPWTTSTALGNLSAFFGLRTSARTLWPVAAICLTTSLPTVPVAPVTKINGFDMIWSSSGFINGCHTAAAPYCSIRPEPSSVDHVRCGGHAAVDLDRCPGDVAGPWGRQESDDLGHFRGRSEPAQRQAPRYALAERGNRLGRQQAYDPGIQKGEVDPTETLLQLARDAIRIGKNPRVSPQDCDLAGQAALRRGNGLGILSRHQHREPLFVQNSRRGEPDAAGAARNERGRP